MVERSAPMVGERFSASLLAELYELEEDGHRLALRQAKRIGCGPAARTLRAIAGHAGEALDELPELARRRHVHLNTVTTLATDVMHRARDIMMDQLVDH